MNICDLLPQDFSIFLILRDGEKKKKNGNKNSVLSLNLKKKEGCSGSEIRKFEVGF